MNAAVHPAAKALWYIENHFGEELTLDDIASAGGVSRFHMARAFEARMGRPVMSYVRARRLSLAALSLANGASDILSVALEAGYGSHQAFTRAFREEFGLTPDAVRDQGHIGNLPLQEPIPMDTNIIEGPSPHSLQKGRDMFIAGLSRYYAASETAAIPAQWQAFAPYLGAIDGMCGEPGTAYGVCYNQASASQGEEGIEYMTGVEVEQSADLPNEFKKISLKARTYAVFAHRGHISGIRSTWATIWDKWLPESGLEVLPEPFFEKYGPQFDATTGEGGLEIWIPVKI